MQPERCPACGGNNQCEVARLGSIDAQCWCMDMTVAANPAPSTNATAAACFCRDCLGNEKAPDFAGAFPAIKR